MDSLGSVTEIAKAVLASWPLATIVIVIVLKNSISIVLRDIDARIHRIKGSAGDLKIEADFGKGIDKVEAIVPPEQKLIENSKAQKIQLVEDMSRLPPGYIVSLNWLILEQKIKEAVDKYFVREDKKSPEAIHLRSFPADAYLNLVVAKKILPESDIEAIRELRQLRNKAAHNLNPDISVTDALRYTDVVNSLVGKIEAWRQDPSVTHSP